MIMGTPRQKSRAGMVLSASRRRALVPARNAAPAPYPPPTAEARALFSFYPFEIEAGVSGKPAFNNRIRKMKDPLNANGAER